MQESPPRPRRLRAASAVLAGGLALGLSLVGSSAAFAAAPAADSVSLRVTPDTATVGDTVDVALTLLGTSSVYSYSVTVSYDAAIFDYVDGSAATDTTGGFDTVEEADGSVTLIHSRLGTSPAISGDLPASLQLATIGDGDGTIAVTDVTLVDPDGATTVIADPEGASAPVAVEPVVVPPTTPPTTEPTAEPTATPTATPVPTASVDPTSTPAATAADSGSLALTGFGAGALGLFAVLALAVGIVVVRRKAVSAR